MRVIFMGTPQFAVPTLEALVQGGHDVVLVVAQPDKPAGRGQRLTAPPVAVRARELGLACIQPARVRDDAFVQALADAQADVAVVIAYGRILTPSVLTTPPLGAINLHASLLPRWRGAAPIQAAILAGDAQSGVCAQQMQEGLDEGPVICAQSLTLAPTESAGSLHDKLSVLAARVAIEALHARADGRIAVPQDPALVTWAPKIEKSDGLIAWDRDALANERRVRAMSPWPGGQVVRADGSVLKLLEVKAAPCAGQPGCVLSLDPLVVACAQGALELVRVQAAGKKPVEGASWARGARICAGEVF